MCLFSPFKKVFVSKINSEQFGQTGSKAQARIEYLYKIERYICKGEELDQGDGREPMTLLCLTKFLVYRL